MIDQGFIDLRVRRQEGQVSESFWPSFTDIMTVILMIFLIAMVVLLLRNMELLNQLRATMEAERQAMALAQATGKEKDSLAVRLRGAESELERLRPEKAQLEAQVRQLQAEAKLEADKLNQAHQRISTLEARKLELEQQASQSQQELQQTQAELRQTGDRLASAEAERQRLAQLSDAQRQQLDEARLAADIAGQQIRDLEQRLAGAEAVAAEQQQQLDHQGQQLAQLEERQTLLLAERDSLSQERQRLSELTEAQRRQLQEASTTASAKSEQLAQLSEDNSVLRQELVKLRRQSSDKEQELQQLRGQISVTDTRLADLQGEMDDLQVKYDRLVRPARTANNKHVVEIRYYKRGGGHQIEYREPDQTGFRSISRGALEARLAELQKEKPDSLYVKVIFPEGSGLSHSEAWRFTAAMHKYDYYYSDPPPDPRELVEDQKSNQ